MTTEPVLGSLCTGYGGLDLGVLAALGGGRIAWCADPDPHVRQILTTRMPGVPNLGDLRAVDWNHVEPIDVLVAGFPCQDISAAGKRAGIEKGERSGLWTDIVASLRLLRPALLIVENVGALRWRNGGLHRVLGDLAEAGYDALWRSVRASDIGAPHRRERVFLLAWPRTGNVAHAADATSARRRQPRGSRPGAPSATRSPGQPARRGEQRHQAVAHSDGSEPERLRGPRSLAATPREAPNTGDQPHQGGHAVVGRGALVADTNGIGCEGLDSPHGRRRPFPVRPVPSPADAYDAADVPTDAARNGRDKRLPCPTRLQGRPDVALGSPAAATSRAVMDWGDYAPVVHRWEQLLGRSAPHPTQPGRHGRPVLAPAFVEHLMGLPQGWVTDLPLPRTAQLRALGNGVVPVQAAYAVSLLLADLAALTGDEHRTAARQATAA